MIGLRESATPRNAVEREPFRRYRRRRAVEDAQAAPDRAARNPRRLADRRDAATARRARLAGGELAQAALVEVRRNRFVAPTNGRSVDHDPSLRLTLNWPRFTRVYCCVLRLTPIPFFDSLISHRGPKSCLPVHFCSGATRRSDRFNEGFSLRRLQAGRPFISGITAGPTRTCMPQELYHIFVICEISLCTAPVPKRCLAREYGHMMHIAERLTFLRRPPRIHLILQALRFLLIARRSCTSMGAARTG